MSSFEDSDEEADAQSFIIKVWIEDRARPANGGVWRGRITHVPSYERRYLKDLSEIEDFIAPYLEAMGAKPDTPWWLGRWLKRLIGRG